MERPSTLMRPSCVLAERELRLSGSDPVHFGSVWLRSAPFGSVSGLFRVCFGSVSGLFRVRFGSVGWGRGGVRERGFCKGKEYH